jgi:hypothetical protein
MAETAESLGKNPATFTTFLPCIILSSGMRTRGGMTGKYVERQLGSGHYTPVDWHTSTAAESRQIRGRDDSGFLSK